MASCQRADLGRSQTFCDCHKLPGDTWPKELLPDAWLDTWLGLLTSLCWLTTWDLFWASCLVCVLPYHFSLTCSRPSLSCLPVLLPNGQISLISAWANCSSHYFTNPAHQGSGSCTCYLISTQLVSSWPLPWELCLCSCACAAVPLWKWPRLPGREHAPSTSWLDGDSALWSSLSLSLPPLFFFSFSFLLFCVFCSSFPGQSMFCYH